MNTEYIITNKATHQGINGYTKIILISIVILVHSGVWYFVNIYNSLRPATSLNNLTTLVDSWIPYIGWSWFVYYSGHLFILIVGSVIVWQLGRKDFFRIILIICLMIITAGIIQLILPAKSPLPEKMNIVHQWFHANVFDDQYVCFPSLHVALSVLPGGIYIRYFKSFFFKIVVVIIIISIFLSTISLKEHYFVDSVAGVILAIFFLMIFNYYHLKSESQ